MPVRVSVVRLPEPETSQRRLLMYEERFGWPSCTFYQLYTQDYVVIDDARSARRWAAEYEINKRAKERLRWRSQSLEGPQSSRSRGRGTPALLAFVVGDGCFFPLRESERPWLADDLAHLKAPGGEEPRLRRCSRDYCGIA